MNTSHFEGENRTPHLTQEKTSLKEMWYLAFTKIQDALKLIEHSIIESKQWTIMGPFE
jgi:hypothetical protein